MKFNSTRGSEGFYPVKNITDILGTTNGSMCDIIRYMTGLSYDGTSNTSMRITIRKTSEPYTPNKYKGSTTIL